jgi:transposase
MQTVPNSDSITSGKRAAKRRFRSRQERRRIVEESLERGASVAVIARANGVNANQVFHWRKLYREGRLDPKPEATPELLPVRISELMTNDGADRQPARPCSGAIHIELGRIRIRVEGAADPDCLRAILEQLSR